MGHKAARTISFHSSRFFAIFSASPQVRLISFSSVSTLLLQVVLGLPLFLLPGGVHRSAVLGVLLFSILNTCPSHRSLLPLTFIVYIYYNWSWSAVLDWKSGWARISCISFSDKFYGRKKLCSYLPSRPSNTLNHREVQILHFCCTVSTLFSYCTCLMLVSRLNACLAFDSLDVITVFSPLSLLITLPRYVNFSTNCISFPSITKVWFGWLLMFIASVLSVFT